MNNGFFITFEGIDGSGKTQQVNNLVSALRQRGLPVVKTQEPGGSSIGEVLRTMITSTVLNPHSMTELLLYMADRAEHVATVIKPALERGDIVVCDRFYRSTEVYQGIVKRTAPVSVVRYLNDLATQGVTPDLEILIDCSSAVAMRRLTSTSFLAEQDLEPSKYQYKVRQGYLDIIEGTDVQLIDGEQSAEMVSLAVWDIVTKHAKYNKYAIGNLCDVLPYTQMEDAGITETPNLVTEGSQD